jgi:hypothetical protein
MATGKRNARRAPGAFAESTSCGINDIAFPLHPQRQQHDSIVRFLSNATRACGLAGAHRFHGVPIRVVRADIERAREWLGYAEFALDYERADAADCMRVAA